LQASLVFQWQTAAASSSRRTSEIVNASEENKKRKILSANERQKARVKDFNQMPFASHQTRPSARKMKQFLVKQRLECVIMEFGLPANKLPSH
jgi:hypothetical protein